MSDKLDKLFALFERAGSEGERQAAEQAILRLITTHSKTIVREYTFTFPDYGSSHLYRTVCKKYGVEAYRYKGQRYTTVNVKTTKDVEDIIDREFNELFDQWRKLTDEILSDLIERYEIGEASLLEKKSGQP
ncbi:hypothetical protein [Hoeflea sp.]|uniref:hypothetical protein n=1 Tax=Hoeflea sp. TaxID=1940281 RepID=UPI003B024B7D